MQSHPTYGDPEVSHKYAKVTKQQAEPHGTNAHSTSSMTQQLTQPLTTLNVSKLTADIGTNSNFLQTTSSNSIRTNDGLTSITSKFLVSTTQDETHIKALILNSPYSKSITALQSPLSPHYSSTKLDLSNAAKFETLHTKANLISTRTIDHENHNELHCSTNTFSHQDYYQQTIPKYTQHKLQLNNQAIN